MALEVEFRYNTKLAQNPHYDNNKLPRTVLPLQSPVIEIKVSWVPAQYMRVWPFQLTVILKNSLTLGGYIKIRIENKIFQKHSIFCVF